MIVGEWFEGDDMRLAWLQHDGYRAATQRLIQCLECWVDDLAPELQPFMPVNFFDHRDVQWLHDMLAARFRFAWLRKRLREWEKKQCVQQVTLFDEPRYGMQQATLFDESELRRFSFQWYDTLPFQLGNLVKQYPNTVRYVLISVLWPNPDKRGIGAEEAFFGEVIEVERKRLSAEALEHSPI